MFAGRQTSTFFAIKLEASPAVALPTGARWLRDRLHSPLQNQREAPMESSRVSSISSYTQQGIGHPLCAKCDVPMWLTRIEPDFPHHDKRTFE